jgi:hypothetical protein
VLLATFPGISQTSVDQWAAHWCWGLSTRSATRLFAAVFQKENITVQAYGNVLAAISFLQGIAVEELTAAELAYRDPRYEMLITVRAVKPGKSV